MRRWFFGGIKHTILGKVARLPDETVAVKRLEALEEAVKVQPEDGGFQFTDWERDFIRDARRKHGSTGEFKSEDRDTIKHLWDTFKSKKRGRPEELAAKFGEKKARRRAPWER